MSASDGAAARVRLEDVLPHRPPMVLLDAVEGYDSGRREVTASVVIGPAWRENWAAIEFMAQAAAALAGVCDREEAGREVPPKPGFLLGTRRLELMTDAFEVGRTCYVRAREAFSDGESASFDCEVYERNADGAPRTLARATLNAYRPASVASFAEAES